jgi:anti-anti-sigma regulatory factor
MVYPSEDRMSEVQLKGDLRPGGALRQHVESLRSLLADADAEAGGGEKSEIRVNLSGVTDMNTSLLAALLALGAEAMRSGTRLVVTGAPDFFHDYVDMTGVEEALRRACSYQPE